MNKHPISEAPIDDKWRLLLDPHDDGRTRTTQPWVIGTRGDYGWHDEDGYPLYPTHFADLPDPQPSPTGWRPAEGTVEIDEIVSGPFAGKWVVQVFKPDGNHDPDREPLLCDTLGLARTAAAEEGLRLKLPVIDRRVAA